jgi:hypothetical protein
VQPASPANNTVSLLFRRALLAGLGVLHALGGFLAARTLGALLAGFAGLGGFSGFFAAFASERGGTEGHGHKGDGAETNYSLHLFFIWLVKFSQAFTRANELLTARTRMHVSLQPRGANSVAVQTRTAEAVTGCWNARSLDEFWRCENQKFFSP